MALYRKRGTERLSSWDCCKDSTKRNSMEPFVIKLSPRRVLQGLRGTCTRCGLEPESQRAHACPTHGELRVVPPPIHPRVRLADNGGKFFVLCFQPVTFPCALCAQVTRASARETMATADSRSARDRHWKSRALRTPCTIQAHSPRSGNRQARPRPGLALEDLHLKTGCAPRARCFCTVVSVAVARAPVWSKLPAPERERQISGREIYS